MLTKEKGYDEFLAESILQGKTDAQSGRVISAEQSRLMARRAIQKKVEKNSA